MRCSDDNLPSYLIFYAVITVFAAIFAPENTPESVKISILVSGQTALGGAAGMARAGKNDIENIEKVNISENESEPEK